MHLLATAGEVVLNPGVALEFVTQEVSQNHMSCFCVIRLYFVGTVNQAKKQNKLLKKK
jgi:hypothetical protein